MSASQYASKREAASLAYQVAERQRNNLGNARLVLAAIGLFLLLFPLYAKDGLAWWGLLPLGLGFAWLGLLLDRASERLRSEAAAHRYFSDGLCRMQAEGDWPDLDGETGDYLGFESLPPAERYEASEHAFDLDLFGRRSVFQLLNRAVTERGRDRLASWLEHPASFEEAKARQSAAAVLAKDLALREAIARAGGRSRAMQKEAESLAWIAEIEPQTGLQKLWRPIGLVMPPIFITSGVLYLFGVAPGLFTLLLILQFGLLMASRSFTAPRVARLVALHEMLTRYAKLIEVLESYAGDNAYLKALQARLQTEGQPASLQLARLRRYSQQLEMNQNAFFGLSIGVATLWELNWVLTIESWRREVSAKLDLWLDAIADFEAIASLGAFAAEHPHYGFPELTMEPGRYEAEGLLHPLINPKQAVPNQLSLGGPGSVLLLSGSNMSGKSSLLRAVGLSVDLARMGSVVPATRLVMGPLRLMTSVRILDSLDTGTSHLYAELLRLKAIIDKADEPGAPLLYLLDEVLHGTNSKERFVGAMAVVRYLAQRGAIGMVTTHDLSLTRLQEVLEAGQLRNAHLSDQVGEDGIVFDYVLKEGPVKTTNALRLMRRAGIEVDFSGIEAKPEPGLNPVSGRPD